MNPGEVKHIRSNIDAVEEGKVPQRNRNSTLWRGD